MVTTNPSDELYNNITYPPQWANLWKFTFDDNNLSEFYVTDVSIPTIIPSLSVENIPQTGKNFYSNAEISRQVTVTYRENVNFLALRFFSLWASSIYDMKNGYFKSGDHSLDAHVTFYKYAVDTASLSNFALNYLSINKALVAAQMAAGTLANNVLNLINNSVGGVVGNRLEGAENLLKSSVLSGSSEDTIMDSDAVSKVFTRTDTSSFYLKGLLLLNVDGQQLTYGESSPLTCKATMSVESVTREVDNKDGTEYSSTGKTVGSILGRII